jgi:hypothetical protein
MERPTLTQSESNIKALLNAAEGGDDQAVQKLLDEGVPVDSTNLKGVTPLMLAAYEYLPSTTAILVKAGASLVSRDLKGNTPLHWAVERNELAPNLACIEMMLDADANIEARNDLGETPLFKCIKCAGTLSDYVDDHAKPALLLIERGADVTVCNFEGKSLQEQLLQSSRGFSDQEFRSVQAAIQGKLLMQSTASPPAGSTSNRRM